MLRGASRDSTYAPTGTLEHQPPADMAATGEEDINQRLLANDNGSGKGNALPGDCEDFWTYEHKVSQCHQQMWTSRTMNRGIGEVEKQEAQQHGKQMIGETRTG